MFEITGAKLVVDTSQLDAAIKKVDDLNKSVAKAEKDINKTSSKAAGGSRNSQQDAHVREYGKSLEEAHKKGSALEKLNQRLFQTLQDLSNGFTRGESSVLRLARNLGASDKQMQMFITHLKDIGALTKDPFDSAIGSTRRLTGELDALNNRAALATKGVALTAKQAKEYSKIADEIAGKMKGQGMTPYGQDNADYLKKVSAAQEEYLNVAKQVNALNQKEAKTVVPSSRSRHITSVNEGDLLAAKFQANENKKALAAEKATERILASLEKRTNKMNNSLMAPDQTDASSGNALRRMFQANALSGTGFKDMETLFSSGNQTMIKAVTSNIAAQEALHKQNTRTVKSTKEMAFAMRQVPMQITDIAVSLAGGQSPFQVLMQQGGQLKDLFGGVKEAAVALAIGIKDALVGAFRLLVSPVGLALTAITAIGSAFYINADRAQYINKSLILLGNTTNITAEQMTQAASKISSATGSSLGSSAEAFASFAKGSKMTADEIANLTTLAVNLEKVGGQSISATVEAAKEFQADPLTAMQKYNKELGFLTPELVKSAMALMNQGKEADAAKVLFKGYAAELENMRGSLQDNLGETERLWLNIKSAIIGATDATIGFFKQGDRKELPWLTRIFMGKEAVDNFNRLMAEQSSEEEQKRQDKTTEQKKAGAQTELWKLINTQVESRKNGVNARSVDDLIKRSGDITDPALQKAIADLKKSPYYTGVTKGESNKAATEAKRLQDLADNLNLQGSTLSSYSNDYLKKKGDIQGLFAKKKISPAAYAVSLDELEKSQGWYKQFQAAEKQDQEVRKINTNIQEQIDLQIMQIDNQTKGLGLTEKEKLVREEMAKLEATRLRTLNDIAMNANLDPATRLAQTAAAEAKFKDAKVQVKQSAESMYDQTHSFTAGWDIAFAKYQDQAKNAAAFGESAFTKMTDGMTDAIMQFVETGKVSFGSLANSIIADIIRMQLKANLSKLLGDSSGSGSGIGGLLGSLATAWLGGSSSSTTTTGPSSATGMSGSWLGSGQSLNMKALGGAYSYGGIEAFANGGVFTNSIVSNPTLFGGKFANGGSFGVMGEAGPEAIMPLSRDTSGKLGVSVNDGMQSGVSVVINNNGNAVNVTEQKESTDSRGNRRIELTISEATAKEQSRPGSAMHNSTKNTFSLKTSLVPR